MSTIIKICKPGMTWIANAKQLNCPHCSAVLANGNVESIKKKKDLWVLSAHCLNCKCSFKMSRPNAELESNE